MPMAPQGQEPEEDLSALTKAELLELAEELDIAGTSHMTKDELIAAIEAESTSPGDEGGESAARPGES